MEDEILEFNYRQPKKSRHLRGCTCIGCRTSPDISILPKRGRSGPGLGISSRGVGEGKKVQVRIPRIDMPHIIFNDPAVKVSKMRDK